ncbi:hypothetical protein V2A60_008506 [Cordyceps javanica]
MHQPNITRFAALHPFRHSERERSSRGDETSYHTIRGSLDPRLQTADQRLRLFAAFVLGLVGDDEVSFDFIAPNTEAFPESGCIEVTRVANELALTTSSQESQSDFGIALLQDGQDTGSQYFAGKPFVVVASESNYSLRLSLDLVPEPFLEAISSSFLSMMEWPENPALVCSANTQSSPFMGTSVINHPPLMTPPDFESQLGLSSSLSQSKSYLLQTAFSARVREHPDKVAVDFLGPAGRTQFTYRELDHLSSILAQKILQKVGADADQYGRTIIVALDTSAELYIAWLGILKARCVVAPVPTDCPPELLQHMTDVTGSKLVLGSAVTLERFQNSLENCAGFTFIDVATITDSSCQDTIQHAAPSVEVYDSDVAYILFTSGSTGKPKGVQITHYAAISAVAAQIAVAPHSFISGPSNIRWFQMVAPAFDMSVTEIFVTLSVGGTLCSCDRTMMLTDAESVIEELGANVTLTTPSLASLLRPERVPQLRAVWTGGEMLREDIASNFAYDGDRATSGQATYSVNGYGPTETTIFCTMDPNVSTKYRVSLIGPPLPTCSVVILDLADATRAVPMGFAGEIAIGGPHLSIGYLKSPEKTAAAFVDIEPFGKLYRSGDKGRVIMGPDGTPQVEYLGRLSSGQVKILGRRVELGEIENGLKNPLISEVAVVALKTGGPDQKQVQLVAIVCPDGTQEDRDILARCKDRAQHALQPHMRPSRYYTMSRLPRLTSDKTDRKTLDRLCASPEESGLRLLVDDSLQEPIAESGAAPLSSVVIDAVSRVSVLGKDGIVAGATLMSLGIDSLRSVRLLQIFRESGIEGLQVTDILTSRNLGELNAKAEKRLEQPTTVLDHSNIVEELVQDFEARHKAQCLKSLGLESQHVESILPATTSQAVTLASYLLTADVDGASSIPGLKAYIQHTIFHVRPDLSAENVITSWVRVLSRYDIMRAVFVPADDDVTPFAQCILASDHASAMVKPYTYTVDNDNNVQDAITKAQEDANNAITLQEPPRRLSVIQTPTRTIVLFSILHSIFDGGSEAVLWEDVEREYLEHPTIERTGITTAVARHFSHDRKEAADYWRSYLDGLTSPAFPSLRSTIPGSDELGCGGFSFVSDLLLDTVTRQAAALQASPLSVFQAAWAYVLLTYTGERDVAFGNVVSDRFTDELANCSAPVLTVHPVRIALGDDNKKRNIDVLLEGTKQNATGLSYLHTPITGARYDTTLALQMYLNTGKGAALYDKVEHPGMQNDQAVMIEVYPHSSGVLEFRATYQYALLDDATARSMLQDLAKVTENIISNPEKIFLDPTIGHPQHEIDLTPQRKNNEHLGRQLLHECVAENARKSPSAIALLFYNDLNPDSPQVQLTYAELEKRSDIVAMFLLGRLKEEGRKCVVPICMEKCPELYIAILGVLKAGASWCPIDPSYPTVRQRLLIEKANTEIVLTSEKTTSQLAGTLQDSCELVNIAELIENSKHVDGQSSETLASAVSGGAPIAESDIAYVIFTSGTTGTPKGVPISHKAASVSIDSFIDRVNTNIDLTGTDIRYLQFANYTFDVFVRDLFAAWKLGGTLVSASREILLGSFTALANTVGATHASMTPTFASTLNPEDLRTLRVVTMGGEKLPQALADRWVARMSLCNVYGPAETAINATINNLHHNSRSANIGTALPAVDAFVMVDGYPVMKHGLGELVLSGVQLSPGYWDSADGNDKFRWNDYMKCRVYHTGDYVRQLLDGTFDFVGRKDDLVKIRGMRVEMGEISTVCSAGHESVVHAEVVLSQLPGSTGDALICFIDCGQQDSSQGDESYILVTEDAQNIAQAVKAHARTNLPLHMIPDVFIPLKTLPRNQSAKVNRKQLSAILATEWSAEPTSQTDVEMDPEWYNQHQAVFDIIRTVAKITPSSLTKTTTLAEIGVDSIGAIRLSSKLKNAGHNVSAVQVLESATIDDLVAHLSGDEQPDIDWKSFFSAHLEVWRPLVSKHLAKAPSQFYTLPTTVSQDGMLIETLRSPTAYWGSFAWTLSSDIDTARLRKAWEDVCKSNDILRLSILPTALVEQQSQAQAKHSSPMFLQIVEEEAAINWVESAANAYALGQVSEKRCQVSEAFSRLMLRTDEVAARSFWHACLSPLAKSQDFEDSDVDNSEASPPQIRHRTIEMKATHPTSRLARSAQKLGATSLSPLFRVAFGCMLSDYCESESVLFGEVRSERLLNSRLVDAMAPLSATYPVPFRPVGSVKDLILIQQNLIMQGIRHGPPESTQVRKTLGKGQKEALYPAIFVLHPHNQNNGDNKAPWEEIKDVLDPVVDHGFALNVFENADDTITLSLSVDETMMTPSLQGLFLQHLDALAVAFETSAPETTLSELTEQFPSNLLSVYASDVQEKYPPKVRPTSYVEKWAEEHPDWTAVEVATEFMEDGGILTENWTYKHFNQVANQVANLILSFNVPGRAVGVSLDRSLIAFAVIIGILKSGCTYVPIEMSLPSDRKAFLLKDSKAALAFVCEGTFDGVDLPADTLLLDVNDASFLGDLATRDTANIQNVSPADQDAYILYTSGSTGVPKGVQVSRQNLSSFASAWGEFIGTVCPKTLKLGGSGKFLNLASRAFDVHIGEMFLAWRFGLCAVTGERLSMLDDLPRTLKELRVTHVGIVPSLLDQTGLLPEDVSDLVYLAVGGEKMTSKTQQIWSSSDRIALVNAYGPTEVTVGCSAARIWPDSNMQCIGHPLGDSVAHVLVPESDTHVKKGVAGELVFEGSLVANGYLNRPDAKGFCVINGKKMYRTGDIVRMDADNSILFLGRKDEQVKVRGQRLELGEVSEVVRSLSSTESEVATLLLKHPGTSKQFLVSFLAPHGSSKNEKLRWIKESQQNSLQEACAQTLPAYMVPDFIIPVTTIPLRDTSAKTDAKALENLFRTIPLQELFGETPSASETETKVSSRDLTLAEKNLLSVVESVIAPDEGRPIGPETTLFQLGFDSVSSVKLSFTLRRLGYNIPVARLLQNPSLESLCRMSYEAKPAQTGASGNPQAIDEQFEDLERRAKKLLSIQGISHVESVRPCMPLQEVLVAHTMTHESEVEKEYISHMVFELGSGVSLEGVKAAWTAVVKKHELLRTCFMRLGNDIVQLVLEDEHYTPDWRHISEPHNMTEAQLNSLKKELANDIASKIDRLPPLRFTTTVCNDAKSTDKSPLFMLSIHHALYDMVSIKMIFQDFETSYKGQELPERRPILPLLKHIAAQQLNGDVREHWTNMFKGYSHSMDATTSHARRSATKTFSTSLANLEGMCSERNTTLSAVNQGVFGYVLSQKLKRDDLVFGIVLSGRSVEVEGIESMAAPCISTIPQRLCLGADGKTLSALVKTSQDKLYGSMEYQYTPLRSLQRWLGISGPLFSSLFSFTRNESPAKTADEEPTILQQVEGEMFLDFELALECEANSATDSLTLRASSTMFATTEELDDLLDEMQSVVSDLLHGQDKAIDVSENVSPNGIKTQPEDSHQWLPIEEQLRDIVAEFSNCPPVEISRTAPLIKYDIDSITTIRFSKMLRQNGFQVSGADVLRNPSIAKLALHIGSKNPDLAHKEVADKSATSSSHQDWSKDMISGTKSELLEDVIAVYPLTPLQAGMVTATVMMDASLYSLHHVVGLPQGVSKAKAKAAWCDLVSKHDILRTSFHETSAPRSQLVGAVHQNPTPSWTELEVAGSVQAAIDDLASRTRFINIASFEKPPVSATLIHGPQQTALVVSLHHATYDGISIGFIFKDLWALLHGSSVPDRKPFYEFATAIHTAASKSATFWVDSLAGYHGVAASEPSSSTATVISRTAQLTNNVSLLEQRCADDGVTVQTACQLAVGKAICAHTNSRDVVLGQVHAARFVLPGADEVAGPMLNTVPLRIRLTEDSLSNGGLLRDLQALQNDALDHLHASLSDIQQLWRQTDASNDQLFEVLFVFRKGEDAEESTWPTLLEQSEQEKQALPPSQYDLVVEVHQTRDDSLQLQVYSKYSEEVTDHVVQLLVDSYQSIEKRPEERAIASPSLLAKLPTPGQATTNGTAVAASYDSEATERYLESLVRILSETTDNSAEKMDAQTSIYSLGVDSIVAIRVAGQCRRAQIPLTTMDILRNAKLGKLCEVALAKAAKQDSSRDLPKDADAKAPLVGPEVREQALSKLGKRPEDVQDVLPVLAGQEFHLALWLKSGKTLYEPTWVFKTRGELDADRLRSAWLSLMQANDSLRTCFAQVQSTTAVQVILKPSAVQETGAFTVLQVPESMDLETFVKSEISRLYRSPSSLYDPPVHLYLIRGGSRGDALLMKLHHTVYDAWSVGIIIDELTHLYRGNTRDELPAPLSFSKFVEFTYRDLQAKNEQQFWTKALQGCEPTVVEPLTAVKEDAPRQRRPFALFDCGETSKLALESAARTFGVTVHCLIIVAFGRMLSEITSATASPVFGYYTAGRSAEVNGMDRLASPTVNMLPISVPEDVLTQPKSGGAGGAREKLQEMQERLLSRSGYEQSRLRDVMGWAAAAAATTQSTAGSRLFNTHLNILWNDEILLKSSETSQSDAILQPWSLGVPSDYASVEPLSVESAVDGLDTTLVTTEAIYADVGISPDTGNVAVGIGGHAKLRDVAGLKDIARIFAKHLSELVEMSSTEKSD